MRERRNGRACLWGTLLSAVLLSTAAAAFQAEQKKDADLPPEIAKLPFEIRDGYRRFVKRCTTCHDSKRVEEAKKSLFDWQGTIGTMAFKKGADIPLEDRQPIFLYLTYLHGTKGTPEEKDQYLTFLTKCEDCHGVSLMYKEKQPMKQWPEIIHRMAGKNRATITPEDEKKVMGYINRMHPDLFGIE
jgi:nitrate/TMAO reductase-like tetraheme cytochrome c subunit